MSRKEIIEYILGSLQVPGAKRLSRITTKNGVVAEGMILSLYAAVGSIIVGGVSVSRSKVTPFYFEIEDIESAVDVK